MEIIVTIIIILINVTAVLNVLLILSVFFGARLRLSARTLTLAGGIYFILNIGMAFIKGSDAYTWIVVLLYMMVAILILSDTKGLQNTFLAIPAALMYVQWGTMFSVFERLTGLDKYGYNYRNLEWVTPLYFVSDILLLLLLLWIWKRANQFAVSLEFTKAESVAITVVCVVYPVVVAFFSYAEKYVTHPLYKPFWLFIMVLMNVAVVYAVVHRKKAAYYKMLAKQYKDQFQVEYDAFKDYKDNNKELIKFQHDWNNHMLVLQEMFHLGDYEKARTYFSDLVSLTGSVQKHFVTGNEIVDMLLKSKYELLEHHGISFNMTGNLSMLGFMEDVDCCILFANLLDNAIEANIDYQGKRYIHLKVRRTKGFLYIQMDNPCAGEPNKGYERNRNAGMHGIGLQNVAEIVQKYEGEYKFLKKKEIFVVTCCFSNVAL